MKVSRSERCAFHAAREAVARCPECARFFCRECISEHDDRVLCASCLGRGMRARGERRPRFRRVGHAIAAAIGLCTAWWFFDLVGSGLTSLPVSVHEGSIWEDVADEQ
jgi:hypothetical protein